MKLFISQPMNGLTNEEIKEGRAEALNEAAEVFECSVDDIEVIESYFDSENNEGEKPLKMLGEAISKMADADAAYFYDGWSNYRGCMIEFECATQYGIPVVGHDVDHYYLDDDYYESEEAKEYWEGWDIDPKWDYDDDDDDIEDEQY